MKSITLHKIDDETEKRLVEISKREGASLNHVIKKLLREVLGIEKHQIDHRSDFTPFCGQWTAEEKAEFDKSTAVFSEIDDEVWQ